MAEHPNNFLPYPYYNDASTSAENIPQQFQTIEETERALQQILPQPLSESLPESVSSPYQLTNFISTSISITIALLQYFQQLHLQHTSAYQQNLGTGFRPENLMFYYSNPLHMQQGIAPIISYREPNRGVGMDRNRNHENLREIIPIPNLFRKRIYRTRNLANLREIYRLSIDATRNTLYHGNQLTQDVTGAIKKECVNDRTPHTETKIKKEETCDTKVEIKKEELSDTEEETKFPDCPFNDFV